MKGFLLFGALLLGTSACGHVAPGAREAGSYSGGSSPASTGTSTGPYKPGWKDPYEQCDYGKDCNNGTRLKPHP